MIDFKIELLAVTVSANGPEVELMALSMGGSEIVPAAIIILVDVTEIDAAAVVTVDTETEQVGVSMDNS